MPGSIDAGDLRRRNSPPRAVESGTQPSSGAEGSAHGRAQASGKKSPISRPALSVESEPWTMFSVMAVA